MIRNKHILLSALQATSVKSNLTPGLNVALYMHRIKY